MAEATQSLVIQDALAAVVEGKDLPRAQCRAVLTEILEGSATGAQIGAFLMGLRMKGETVEEIAGAAEAMRAFATPVVTARSPLLDTCGTGGDGLHTFNISTAVAFVAAACGVAVAKHGNRSVSSRSGSADVLEAAGVKIDLTAEQMGRCLDEVGLAFLFAPVLHPAMRHALGPRREMRLRTLFNLIGPLANPAGADCQLLGVYDAEKARLLAGVLGALGSRRAWVVHGLDGLDELSLCGESIAFCIDEENGTAEGLAADRAVDSAAGLSAHPAVDRSARIPHERRISPEEAGLTRAEASSLRGGDPAQNARWLVELLKGAVRDASRDVVVLNAAAALVVAGKAQSLRDGRDLAEGVLNDGRAARVLEHLRVVSRRV